MRKTHTTRRSLRAGCRLLVVFWVGLHLPWAGEQTDLFPAYRPSAQDVQAAQTALEAATIALSTGNLEEAANRATQAARLIPISPTPLVLLGMVAEKQERTTEAVNLYRKALAWDPDNENAAAGLQRLGAPRYSDVVSQYEDQLVRLINKARAAHGLNALKPHPVLAEVAREHSAAMRDLGFFSHTSPKPGRETILARFLRRFEGYSKHLGENVARRYWRPTPALNEQNIALSHQELMGSPHHRANILHPTSEYVGVGIAVNAEGDYWITELFMEPRAGKDVQVIIPKSRH